MKGKLFTKSDSYGMKKKVLKHFLWKLLTITPTKDKGKKTFFEALNTKTATSEAVYGVRRSILHECGLLFFSPTAFLN